MVARPLHGAQVVVDLLVVDARAVAGVLTNVRPTVRRASGRRVTGANTHTCTLVFL